MKNHVRLSSENIGAIAVIVAHIQYSLLSLCEPSSPAVLATSGHAAMSRVVMVMFVFFAGMYVSVFFQWGPIE